MRGLLLVLWLLAPVAAAAYHYGPGQDYLSQDDADRALRRAAGLVAEESWAEAIVAYDEALKMLPASRVGENRRIRLERAKAQMMARQLPLAHGELLALSEELKGSEDAKLVADARSALASAQFYMTWLMRLEGLGQEMWEPEIEASRQSYKLLAEQAEKQGESAAAQTHREDLEAAIRLARMDLADLQALPLKRQCQGCCSGMCSGNGRGNSKGRGQQQPSKNPNRGAGGEMPPDTRGH
jgi:hypothetical protein